MLRRSSEQLFDFTIQYEFVIIIKDMRNMYSILNREFFVYNAVMQSHL